MSDLPFGASEILHRQRREEVERFSRPGTDKLGVQERAARILAGNIERLSQKDLEFIRGIRQRGYENLTPKQSKWFRDVENRAMSAS